MNKKMMLKNTWHMARTYWKSEERWKARGLLGAVIALSLGQVYMLVLLNGWNKDFYNALQKMDYGSFWPLIGMFSLYAFIYIFIAVYAIYLRQMLQINWRTWMTDRYMQSWMDKQVYYRLGTSGQDMDNPDQRISEDINSFISLTLQLGLGILKQLTTLVAFVFILWDLSGKLNLPLGDTMISIPGYMVFVSLGYSIVGTYLANKIGKKLIGLNYDQQRYEADFRFSMVRVRENSESIAFYGGEKPELLGFKACFSKVIGNFWELMKRTRLLNFYSVGYEQLAIIVPVLMAAPRYFSGEMQLGGFMQTISAFGRVQNALSYFVDAYSSIAEYAAVIRRLGGFTQHMEEVDAQVSGFTQVEDVADANSLMELDDVNIMLPEGSQLVKGLSFKLKPGDRLLINGESGSGKSTLLRALAGIWRDGSGRIAYAKGCRKLFLSQRPYLPQGTLRQAIYYPQPVPENSSDDMNELLESVGLERLVSKLDIVDNWSRVLSIGEQQRLAFLRIFLFKPQLVFLDESTSAMDEFNEANAYEMLYANLPEAAVVSVAHRPYLLEVHTHRLKLLGGAEWSLGEIKKV